MRRFCWILGWVAVVVALSAAPAAARTGGGIDRSFGDEGFIHYGRVHPGYLRSEATATAVAPDGRIYLVEIAVSCSPACIADYFVSRLTPSGHPDRSFADAGTTLVFTGVPSGFPYGATSIAVDNRGRILLTLQEKEAFVVARLLPSGVPDGSFGDGGKTSLPCEDCENTHLRLHPEGGGGVLLWGSHLGPTPMFPSTPPYQEPLLLARLSESGRLDQGFGEEGWVGVRRSGTNAPAAAAVKPGGAIVLAGLYACCRSLQGAYFERFGADGTHDAAFARRSAHSLGALRLPAALRPQSVAEIVPRRHGVFDVFGNSEKGGYVLRIRSDGRVDRRFGHDGFKRFRVRLQAIARAGEGKLWAIGSSFEYSGALAFMLGRNDRIDRSFGGRHHVVGLAHWDATEVEIGRQGSRAVLFSPGFQFCRQYCPPAPELARLAPGTRRHHHHSGR